MVNSIKLIGTLVFVCILLLLFYNNKMPFIQNTQSINAQSADAQPTNTNKGEPFVDDLDDLINNIYYIQLHTK
jgi:hypothetical protein